MNNPIVALAEHEPHAVSMGVTIFFALILVSMIACLAFEEKLHAKKSIIVGLFAVLTLFLGDVFHILPVGDLVNVFGEEIHLPVYIPGVDWGVIAIILGSGIFVDVISKSGLFTWIAIKLTKASKGDPLNLLMYYGWMTVLFSAVLNNVTAMIIVGSLTGVSLKKLDKMSLLLGFLFIEGLLTNIGGLLTLISSVPNIIVGNTAGISFITFFLTSGPYVVVTTIVTLYMGAWLFKIKALSGDEEKAHALERVGSFDENDGIESKKFFLVAGGMLAAFILTIATTSILPYIRDLGMGYVALSFAAIALIKFKSTVEDYYRAIDWDLLGFFVALFAVINVMEHAHVLNLIGQGMGPVIAWGEKLGMVSVMFGSALFSSVTDNIPLSAILAKILSSLQTPADSSLWWAVIFGANLGGNLTPIGSASTLVAVTIIHKYKLRMSFGKFVTLALPYAAIQIVMAAAYVLLFV